MSKGRKPKPANIHQLEGTYRSDRHGPPSKHPETIDQETQMKCPSWIPERARNAFKTLRESLGPEGMDILAKQDRHALIMLCEAWDEWREAKRIIKNEGLYYDTYTEGGAEMKRSHPVVAQRNDAFKRVQSMLAEFGLTPATRTSVMAKLGGEGKQNNQNNQAQNPKRKSWMS